MADRLAHAYLCSESNICLSTACPIMSFRRPINSRLSFKEDAISTLKGLVNNALAFLNVNGIQPFFS